ncbi:MAG: hypothetical protein K2X27_05535 [Candidatus Obscuribacterales bacterium]|nr:hypothetical protein [Candidatus Obscuribacterales bacterium]
MFSAPQAASISQMSIEQSKKISIRAMMLCSLFLLSTLEAVAENQEADKGSAQASNSAPSANQKSADSGKGQLTIAQAGKRTQLKTPGTAAPTQSSGELSASAKEIADLAGITPLLTQLADEQKIEAGGKSLESVIKRQKLLYLRSKINAIVQAANLQINSTRGKIDAATAQADELRAYITERRNRQTHRNSQVNLLSGGVTKIVGYSIALAGITDVPTNVLEVFDGSVQTSLTGLALRQEKQEAKLEHGMPSILAAFLNERQTEYPGTVWQYLNNTEPGSSPAISRRQQLINNWQNTGVMVRARIEGQSKAKRNVTIELLDQRLAMLSDVRSAVSEMHYGLMELSNLIVQSFAKDPEF